MSEDLIVMRNVTVTLATSRCGFDEWVEYLILPALQRCSNIGLGLEYVGKEMSRNLGELAFLL